MGKGSGFRQGWVHRTVGIIHVFILISVAGSSPPRIAAQTDGKDSSTGIRLDDGDRIESKDGPDSRSEVDFGLRPEILIEYRDPEPSTYDIDPSRAGFRVLGSLDVAFERSELTVAATIHPDYRHLAPDPSVLNLTDVEIFFEERRPFFGAAADSFRFSVSAPFSTRGRTFANDRAFHSRRVGADGRELRLGSPDVRNSPDEDLVAATAVSASLSDQWSVRVLDGLTRRPEAENGSASLTNYSVGRFGGKLTSTLRLDGIVTSTHNFQTSPSDGLLPGSAYSLGLAFAQEFDGFHISGTVLGSQVRGDAHALADLQRGPGHYFQRPDARHLRVDSSASSLKGLLFDGRIMSKETGSWSWLGFIHVISPGLDINELGFQRDADWVLLGGRFAHQLQPASGMIERISVGVDEAGIGWSFGGERRAAVISVYSRASFANGWTGFLSYSHEFPALSTDLLQGGPAFLLSSEDAVRMEWSTDSDRSWSVALRGRASYRPESGGYAIGVSPSLRLMSASNLTLSIRATPIRRFVNPWQYLTTLETMERVERIVGRFDLRAMSARLQVEYTPSPELVLRISSQPYLSAARMTDLAFVRDADSPEPEERLGGDIDPTELDVPTRVTATELRTRAMVRWKFSTTGAVSLIWRQDGSVFDKTRDGGVWRRVSDLRHLPGTDEIVLKLSYGLAWGESSTGLLR